MGLLQRGLRFRRGARVTENELQREVFRLLHARPDLTWHHCTTPARCQGERGMPDLLIIGRRVLWRELKGDETRYRMHQLDYADLLARAGQDVGTWRSADLESGRIRKELDDIR